MNVDGMDISDYSSPSLNTYATGQANETNSDMANSYMEGTGASQGLLNPIGKQGAFDSTSHYGDNATLSAIRSRANVPYNIQMGELSTNTMRAADADHIRNLQVASNMATQEVEQNRQKDLLAYSIDQANKRARGAILGSILGITGGIAGGVGGAFAGGPTGAAYGAMGGYALGSGAGEMIGTGS